MQTLAILQFIYQNLQIQNNVIHSAHLNNVQKLLFLGSSYLSREAAQPMKKMLLTDVLEPTNGPYAIAKIAGKKGKICNRQYRETTDPLCQQILWTWR